MRLVLLPLALLGLLAAIGLASGDASRPPTIQPDVKLVEIGRFEQPIYVTSPPGDKRLFVVEKTGRIWVLVRGRQLRQPFLDLSRRVSSRGTEQGLLSLAFAPDYASTGLFYVDYTDRSNRVVVEEYRRSRDPDRADPRTARVVLVIPHRTERHYGGHVLFGPDGNLYISKGDGGAAALGTFASQDLGDLNGKLLRIDPRPAQDRPYGIPKDNPFVGRPGRDEIWAYGLRNPWRLAFDSSTQALLVGDVGQNRVEEVDLATRSGLNFGWSCFEGTQPYAPNGPPSCESSVPPILERFRIHPPEPATTPKITRGRGGSRVRFTPGEPVVCSIVVGVVVRDPELPSLLGRLLYGDFCDPSIRSFRLEGGRAIDDRPLGLNVLVLSSFSVDAAGHVYATSLAGPVYRLVAR